VCPDFPEVNMTTLQDHRAGAAPALPAPIPAPAGLYAYDAAATAPRAGRSAARLRRPAPAHLAETALAEHVADLIAALQDRIPAGAPHRVFTLDEVTAIYARLCRDNLVAERRWHDVSALMSRTLGIPRAWRRMTDARTGRKLRPRVFIVPAADAVHAPPPPRVAAPRTARAASAEVLPLFAAAA
jgi:hypothetical protein